MTLNSASILLNRSFIVISTIAILNLGGDQTALSQARNIATLGRAILTEVEEQSKAKN
ncbi:hypothetical protein NDI44_27130 [Trichocoleus sp. DQ-A3]|uniref:hypothetical protein n=1 Tax=Cyanophyceae TaxID=3028117 RepID=UPI0016835E0E|nr:hypothetical protein [Coleofasciculus sp. FACHB-125]MBD1903861.1 hypothetical protein [Coleofasciculus sp. FACHB-125]